VNAMPSCVTSWSASGLGRGHLPIVMTTLGMGGQLRVGMEDNVYFARGQKAERNAQFVERSAQLATLAQRPPMSVAEAKAFLGIRA
ncbi:MAG: 3-keto-5-aminohexanoate cleavage protein, partial [Propionibacteriaceae bacterium]